MATTTASGPVYTITTADNGNTLDLGTSEEARVGLVALHIVPDATFVTDAGSLTIVGRAAGWRAAADALAFVPIPYRSLYLNGAVIDGTLQHMAITDQSLILVPAGGVDVGVSVTCTGGTCKVYIQRVAGPLAL